MGDGVLTKVQRPSSHQDEAHVTKIGWHICPKTRKREALFFPVGAAGAFHPNHSPFEVDSIPCNDCDVVVACWFEWMGSRIFDFGAKPKGAK